MRILAVNSTGQMSGAERVLLRYARDLDAWSDWTVATPEGPVVEHLEAASISVVVVPDLRLGDGPRLIEAFRLGIRMMRAVPQLKRLAASSDLVLANSVMALPPLRLARIRQPVVWLVHDVITRTDLAAVARACAKTVDHAIGVSEAACVLPRKLGIPAQVVRNGVTWPVAPASRSPGPPIVGVNAVLTSWKGQREFLEAMRLVPDECKIELLGGTFPKDEPYRQELLAIADAAELRGRVRFVGHSDDPLGEMRRWTVAVSPSIEPEAGPLAVTEAMSLGLAVVVTDHGGAPEAVGGIGRVVPPGDARAMASTISELLRDPEVRTRCGTLGRQRVSEQFTLGEAERGFRHALETVVGRS